MRGPRRESWALLGVVRIPDSALKEILVMLYWAAVFLVIAIVAALFGFGGIAGASASIAQVLFFVFLILFIVSLIFRGPRAIR